MGLLSAVSGTPPRYIHHREKVFICLKQNRYAGLWHAHGVCMSSFGRQFGQDCLFSAMRMFCNGAGKSHHNKTNFHEGRPLWARSGRLKISAGRENCKQMIIIFVDNFSSSTHHFSFHFYEVIAIEFYRFYNPTLQPFLYSSRNEIYPPRFSQRSLVIYHWLLK